jgi:predicted TIM-barrel fold metal-dependent hydrolase
MDETAMTTTPRVVIDAWMQHPGQRWLDDDMFSSLRRWKPGPFSETAQPVETTLEMMDRAGVSQGLLCAWWGPAGPMIPNDDVAALCAAHPDRFVGVASVDLMRPMAAVAELHRCVHEHGFKALRILPWLWGLPPDDRRYYPLYAACCDLDITFCTQVGHAGPMRASGPGRPIPHLDHVALEFPDLRMVGGHIGVPWLDEMISLATKYPNVYIDTSAYTCARYPAALVDYLRGHGRRKVLFGSNHPCWPAPDCLAALDQLELDDATTQAILHDNAAHVFGLT